MHRVINWKGLPYTHFVHRLTVSSLTSTYTQKWVFRATLWLNSYVNVYLPRFKRGQSTCTCTCTNMRSQADLNPHMYSLSLSLSLSPFTSKPLPFLPREYIKLKHWNVVVDSKVNGWLEGHCLQRGVDGMNLIQCLTEISPWNDRPAEQKTITKITESQRERERDRERQKEREREIRLCT